jgi:dTDP-4-dehydrorhamnose 3,5-epimerase
MKVQALSLPGAYLLTPKRSLDERGYFCEVYSRRAFEEHGLFFDFVQDNTSLSLNINTVRGLHFQLPRSAQAKLVWVDQGAVQDVIVDIRRSSPTYGRHLSIELSASNGFQLLVPRGFAHGFLATARDTLLHYKVDAYYDPDRDAGLLWNDPDLGIDWKCNQDQVVLSEKDKKLPLLKDLPLYFP